LSGLYSCSTDCDACHNNQEWQAILNVDCRESFYVTLVTAPDSEGEVWVGGALAGNA
jgi:hypothetical protein